MLRGTTITECLPVCRRPIGLCLHDTCTLSRWRKSVLQHQDDPLEYVYFPPDGLVSLLAMTSDGQTMEAISIGRGGAVCPVGHSCSDATKSVSIIKTQWSKGKSWGGVTKTPRWRKGPMSKKAADHHKHASEHHIGPELPLVHRAQKLALKCGIVPYC